MSGNETGASDAATPGRGVVTEARAKTLNMPRPARVRTRERIPCAVNGEPIDCVRESWLVEDRWWTGRPLRRRYWELVSVRGRNLVVFHDLHADGWFIQGP